MAMTTTRRQIAWMLVLIVDTGFVVWGAMAAAWPEHLLGPRGMPILPAGYEGFSHGSWSALASKSPMTAGYIELLFRLYGVFNVAFGLMAAAITVMAFRRGDGWALVGAARWQHDRARRCHDLRLDRERDWSNRADRVSRPGIRLRPHWP
jgi:hypothetical protein